MVNAVGRWFNAVGGLLMARSGRIGILRATGARTGKTRSAPLGYVARADGTILVGSGRPENRGWVVNLRANPACTFAIREAERAYVARLVGADEREAALGELRAKMGGMAERASWGDLFVLEPAP